MEEIGELIARISASFSDVGHPGVPDRILNVPCCPDHDSWADWLSKHTWQDLAEELEVSDADPTEFSSILPAAYRYFIPGVLTFVVRNIGHNPGDRAWGKRHWRPLDWVYFTMMSWPRSLGWEKWKNEMRSERLPLFSSNQKKLVRNVLEFVCRSRFVSEEEKDNIRKAMREVWESET